MLTEADGQYPRGTLTISIILFFIYRSITIVYIVIHVLYFVHGKITSLGMNGDVRYR